MIVIPMAGLSQRFQDAGYKVPKYMLEAHGRSVFAHAVLSFQQYFSETHFLFIVRDVFDTVEFVRAECRTLGINECHVVALDAPTRGQAETVALGLRKFSERDSDSAVIFNIDTFRPGFRLPADIGEAYGALEVFQGAGENWSFVRPVVGSDCLVAETSEKRPISDLCCTGLYYFKTIPLFMELYGRFERFEAKAMQLKELYVAPMYNLLIRDGKEVRFWKIDSSEVIFCGIPSEYEAFRQLPHD